MSVCLCFFRMRFTPCFQRVRAFLSGFWCIPCRRKNLLLCLVLFRNYDRYVRSPDVNKKYGRAWKRIRDRYAAEHPLCERCLMEGRVTLMDEVHHILPISRGGTHDKSNLMSLCHSCHNKIHIEMGDRHPHG